LLGKVSLGYTFRFVWPANSDRGRVPGLKGLFYKAFAEEVKGFAGKVVLQTLAKKLCSLVLTETIFSQFRLAKRKRKALSEIRRLL
jgi:hypothetical protein